MINYNWIFNGVVDLVGFGVLFEGGSVIEGLLLIQKSINWVYVLQCFLVKIVVSDFDLELFCMGVLVSVVLQLQLGDVMFFFVYFLCQELCDVLGCVSYMLCLMLSCVVFIILFMILQIFFLVVVLIVVFYVSQFNVLMIKLVSVVFFVIVIVVFGGVLLIIKWIYDYLLICLVVFVVFFFCVFYLMWVLGKLGLVFFVVVLVVIYVQIFLLMISQSEILVWLLFWLWVVINIVIFVILLVNVCFQQVFFGNQFKVCLVGMLYEVVWWLVVLDVEVLLIFGEIVVQFNQLQLLFVQVSWVILEIVVDFLVWCLWLVVILCCYQLVVLL